MSEVNAANERAKRRFCDYLREAEGLVDETVDGILRSLADWDSAFENTDYRTFSITKAKQYKRHLATSSGRAGRGLGGFSAITRGRHVQKFFRWLAEQPGYRSHVRHSDIAY